MPVFLYPDGEFTFHSGPVSSAYYLQLDSNREVFYVVHELARHWRVSRKRVTAALVDEPIKYFEVHAWFDGTSNCGEEDRNRTVQKVAVRSDIAERIYRDKIQPTLKTR